MPFYLKDRDIALDIAAVRSALIVPCRFCPAASLAVREETPYIALFRNFLRTPSYEAYIRDLKSRLGREGTRAEVLDSTLLVHFVMCLWTSGRRKALARRAAGYDAVIVLGCDAAVETARYCINSRGCRIIPGMDVEGIMNAIPRLRFPFDIWLEPRGVIRVLQPPAR